jgi:hypothetical protein
MMREEWIVKCIERKEGDDSSSQDIPARHGI